MKGLLGELGEIALIVILVTTLFLGAGSNSLKTQAGNAATQNSTRMAQSNDW